MELGHFLRQQLQQLFIHCLLQDTRDCIVVNTQVKDFVSFFGIIGQTTALADPGMITALEESETSSLYTHLPALRFLRLWA